MNSTTITRYYNRNIIFYVMSRVTNVQLGRYLQYIMKSGYVVRKTYLLIDKL